VADTRVFIIRIITWRDLCSRRFSSWPILNWLIVDSSLSWHPFSPEGQIYQAFNKRAFRTHELAAVLRPAVSFRKACITECAGSVPTVFVEAFQNAYLGCAAACCCSTREVASFPDQHPPSNAVLPAQSGL